MPATIAPPDDSGRLLHDPAKLVAWRAEAGLTRAQVSREAQISYSYLRDIEHGLCTPSLPMLVRLAEFYNHPIGELVVIGEPPC